MKKKKEYTIIVDKETYEEFKEFVESKSPLPPICACGREMKPAYDSVAKKVTGYQWSCECTPGLFLSIG